MKIDCKCNTFLGDLPLFIFFPGLKSLCHSRESGNDRVRQFGMHPIARGEGDVQRKIAHQRKTDGMTDSRQDGNGGTARLWQQRFRKICLILSRIRSVYAKNHSY
ncbi:MAG: hypothetical protein LBG45_06590 [Dysgonamonadaceae bacterium]|jgi:hypothetical protein|nr:hypothetical protein [Dysgonamonadaceae bacterium]